MLAAYPDMEMAGEAETGVEAMEMAAQIQPGVVLLDIQMPGCSGIDVAACLPQPAPAVVFCTAYDQYAVDAFELHAVDYLLKPVSRARAGAGPGSRSLSVRAARESALDHARARQPRPARFLVRNGANYLVIARSATCSFSFRRTG